MADLPKAPENEVEAQEVKKRKRREDDMKDLLTYNAQLLQYIHRLEFALLEYQRKYSRSKVLLKRYIARLAHSLDLAGLSVPTLPHKLFEAEGLQSIDDLVGTIEEELRQGEMELSELGKKRKIAKKKQDKLEVKTDT
jgi:hypothetical protein